MDLNAIAKTIKDSFEIEIIHPATGEGGWFIELASPHHADSQAKVAAILDRARKRKTNSPGQDEKDVNDMLTARILGWRGLQDGEDPVEFTPELASDIISAPKSFWVRRQLMDALGDVTRPFGN